MSDNIENIFIDLLFPKTKPLSVCIIYNPPSQTQFLEQMITEFEALNLNNKIYVLGDFYINLLFWDKYVLKKPNETKKIDKDLFLEIKRYIQRILLSLWPEPIDRLSYQNRIL